MNRNDTNDTRGDVPICLGLKTPTCFHGFWGKKSGVYTGDLGVALIEG